MKKLALTLDCEDPMEIEEVQDFKNNLDLKKWDLSNLKSK